MLSSANDTASHLHRNGWEVVNRIVYPINDATETLPLYAIRWTRPHLSDGLLDGRVDMTALRFDSMNKSDLTRLLQEAPAQQASDSDEDSFRIASRTTMEIAPRRHISLCTFFNAFPGSYWVRWTSVRRVRFTAKVRGTGIISLLRSTGRGLSRHTADIVINDDRRGESATEAPGCRTVDEVVELDGMVDGGYVWAEAEAGDEGMSIADARWSVPSGERTASDDTTMSIAITTFNRAPYCMRQLRIIAGDAGLRSRLDTVYCIDQGTDPVSGQPGFMDVSTDLGPQLTYIRQRNLGGSGGFSRGMYETVSAGKSEYTLLLDDDAVSEPEAILRSMQFADYCASPTIVGGGMLHLDNRTVLYTHGERLDRSRIWMVPSCGLRYNHDFGRFPLRDSPELHKRIDSDFNGWWMCLIPVSIIHDIGLALPAFIKFDDTEYCIRAQEHGYPTVCLPGVAVWHQAWHDKDPGRGWEEYFFQRNRWICALLHSPRPRKRFAAEMLYSDILMGMRLCYSAMALHHLGLSDVLRGPEYIVDSMPSKLQQIREIRSRYPDAQTKGAEGEFPTPQTDVIPPAAPGTVRSVRIDLTKAAIRTMVSRRSGRRDARPELRVSAKDSVWQSFVGVRSALVTSPDGNTVAWFRRDDPLFRRGILRNLRLIHRLMRQWKSLSRRYREYNLASADVWRPFFDDQRKDQHND